MKLCFLPLFIIVCNILPSNSKLLINPGVVSNQYLQEYQYIDRSMMDSEQIQPKESSIKEEKKEIRRIDPRLCSYVCGTYCCQALFLNGLFILLTNMTQWVQKHLNIDTSSILLGKISGFLTVTLGSYVSYKLSEFFVDKILNLFKNETTEVLKEVIIPRKSNFACVNVPLIAFYKISKYFHNQIPFNMGSLDIHIKNKILKKDESKSDLENVKISLKTNKVYRKKFKREFTVISAYSLVSFLLMGGRFHAFTPSELSHPGAYSVPHFSVEAEGYNYATKVQKRMIQMIGKKYGCHSCGLKSQTERYIADHQPPSGVIKRKLKGKYVSFLLRNHLVPLSLVKPKQHFYPQCNKCSIRQSKAVANNRRDSVTHYGRFRPYQLCTTTFFLSRVLLDTKWSKLRRRIK